MVASSAAPLKQCLRSPTSLLAPDPTLDMAMTQTGAPPYKEVEVGVEEGLVFYDDDVCVHRNPNVFCLGESILRLEGDDGCGGPYAPMGQEGV